MVLFPRIHVPLHIFEDRYKLMIGEAIRDNSEFGIVMAADRGVVNAGCTALVSRVMKRYDDGKLDIMTVGRRRFEVTSINQELEYLRAEVLFFDDLEEAEPPVKKHLEQAIRGYYACRTLDPANPLAEPNLNDPQLSFQLAQAVPDLEIRQTLLGLRAEGERLRQLAKFFPPYLAKIRELTHFKEIVPRNGHSKLKDDRKYEA